MQDDNDEQQGQIRIPLDGTYGLGGLAELTIYTKVPGDADKITETTFTIPFTIIDVKRLDAFNSMNLINGYRIVKTTEGRTSLKELGL